MQMSDMFLDCRKACLQRSCVSVRLESLCRTGGSNVLIAGNIGC